MAAQRITTKHRFVIKLLSVAISIAVSCWLLVSMNAPRIYAQSAHTIDTSLPSFEVASIKQDVSGSLRVKFSGPPSRFTASSATTSDLIQSAYGVKDFQISGEPGWVKSERFDIDAKESDSVADELQKLPRDQKLIQLNLMLQSLLVDRFKLKVSHKTKELPIYALVVMKNGPKFSQTTGTPSDSTAAGSPGQRITLSAAPISFLIDFLARQPEINRVVLDQTGLTGKYDFTLQWISETDLRGGPLPAAAGSADAPAFNTSGTSIFTAIQDQLGLKLESTKGPVDTIVIEHIEEPSEN